MRKIITGAFVSLDGIMQALGGPEEDPTGGFKFGGWTATYERAVDIKTGSFAPDTPSQAEIERRRILK